jgi:hypothetical protein
MGWAMGCVDNSLKATLLESNMSPGSFTQAMMANSRVHYDTEPPGPSFGIRAPLRGVCPFRPLRVGRGSLESRLVRLRLDLFPATWLAKAPLEFTQDFMRMDGVMAQQHQHVEPQVSHFVDDLRLGAVLGG